MRIFTQRFIFLLAFCLSLTCNFSLQAQSLLTPTQRYLEHKVDLDTIQKTLLEKNINISHLTPLLQKILSKESQQCFAYHACSQDFRIFQDILRTVFEELFHYYIPNNFHFLRIPKPDSLANQMHCQDFFNLYNRDPFPELSFQKKLLSKTLLPALSKSFSIPLTLEDFDENEIEILWNLHQNLLNFFDHNIKSPSPKSWAAFETLSNTQNYRLIINQKVLFHHRSNASDKIQLLRNMRSSNKLLYTHLFNHLMALEKETSELWAYVRPFNDRKNPQQSLLLSLNTNLFANHHHDLESSLIIFSKGKSSAKGDHNLIEILKDFFFDIGLDTNLAPKMYTSAKSLLQTEQAVEGCLLQFFTPLHQENSFFDLEKDCYVSLPGGSPVKGAKVASIITYDYSDLTFQELPALQLRLLMNGSRALNPYAGLQIRRYDLLSPKLSKKILKELRSFLQSSNVDKNKLKVYDGDLKSLWNM